jgi:type IV pilus assembly protein PilE
MMNVKKQIQGFTLIEVMVTVAIIAILAMIALPSYKEYVMRSRRADAKAALLKVQLAQEKYRASNTSYSNSLADLGFVADSGVFYSPDKNYTMAVTGSTATDYTATATPTGAQTGDSCGTFAVNKEGKTASDSIQTTTAKVEECWGK